MATKRATEFVAATELVRAAARQASRKGAKAQRGAKKKDDYARGALVDTMCELQVLGGEQAEVDVPLCTARSWRSFAPSRLCEKLIAHQREGDTRTLAERAAIFWRESRPFL